MKLSCALVTSIVLGAVVFFAQGQAVPETKVTWNGNLATIEWAEPLADPNARPDEAPFSLLSGPYIGWLTQPEAIISSGNGPKRSGGDSSTGGRGSFPRGCLPLVVHVANTLLGDKSFIFRQLHG